MRTNLYENGRAVVARENVGGTLRYVVLRAVPGAVLLAGGYPADNPDNLSRAIARADVIAGRFHPTGATPTTRS